MNAALVPTLPEVQRYLGASPRLLIEGEHVHAVSQATLPVYNPATGQAIAEVPDADVQDVDRAVQSAYRAFVDGRWSRLRPADRERALLRLADLVDQHSEFLAQLETLEQGKSILVARGVEVSASATQLRYVAGLATKVSGRTLDVSMPAPPGRRLSAWTRREPAGVVAAIAPWNFPLLMAVGKVAPALAAGCTVVLKPSEFTPLTALRLAELALEAGVPPGVFNVVTGLGSSTGAALVAHPLVHKISFTGSTQTGKAIGRVAMDRLTRVSLECGGKNPAVVLKDADPEQVADGLILGGLFNAGQVCAAASRIYVEQPLLSPLTEALSRRLTGLRLGPGMDEQTQVQPLATRLQQHKVLAFLDEARSAGAELHDTGAAAPAEGYFVKPTLVVTPEESLRLHREEVFGPVMALVPVADREDALAKANASQYGLAASVWTHDLHAAHDLIERLQAGMVWVNSHVPIDSNLPFGGYKQSGIGRDFGPDWLDAYTELKAVSIAY